MGELRSYGVFCDDIRQEISGKYILIGMYSGDLIPSTFPMTVYLSTMIWINGLPAGDHPFKVKLSLDGELLHEIEGRMQVTDASQTANVVLSGFPVYADHETLLESKTEIAGILLDTAHLHIRRPGENGS